MTGSKKQVVNTYIMSNRASLMLAISKMNYFLSHRLFREITKDLEVLRIFPFESHSLLYYIDVYNSVLHRVAKTAGP